MGVSHDGSVIVGACADFGVPVYLAARWTGTPVIVEDLSTLLPAGSLPAGWQIQASGVSRDGRTFTGTGYGQDPAFPDDPHALFIEGWVARVP